MLHAGQVQDVASVETTTQAELGGDTDRLQRQQNLEPSTSGSTVMQPSILCARCYSLRHYGYIFSCMPSMLLSAITQHIAIALAANMQQGHATSSAAVPAWLHLLTLTCIAPQLSDLKLQSVNMRLATLPDTVRVLSACGSYSTVHSKAQSARDRMHTSAHLLCTLASQS